MPVRVRVERDIELGIDVFQFGRDCLEIPGICQRDFVDIACDNFGIFGIECFLLVDRRRGSFRDQLVEFRIAVTGRVGIRNATLIA